MICLSVRCPSPHTTSTNSSGNVHFDIRDDAPLVSCSLNRIGRDQHFAGRYEVIAALHRIDNRLPVINSRPRIHLHVVDPYVSVHVIADALLVSFCDGLQIFRRRGLVRHTQLFMSSNSGMQR